MMFFVFVCPPVYFFMRKKIGAAIVSCILCALALFTLFLPPVAFVFAFIAVAHAMVDYGKKERTSFAKEQAEANAEVIARHLKKQEKEKVAAAGD